jgi:aminomethyltransferase
MTRQTCLFEVHRSAGARLTDFSGWQMPLHYGSQIDEHHAVRRACGLFDVSHMRVLELSGPGARGLLRQALANDVDRLAPGRALYSCLLREDGGILDDLIAYRPGAATDFWWLVVNAGTAEADQAWLESLRQRRAPTDPCSLRARSELALIALQGPQATDCLARARPQWAQAATALRPFSVHPLPEGFIARTGYTGEDGFEIAVPVEVAPALWGELRAAGAAACGLGARDTLRLEAGMNLYGQDMDPSVSPLESGLAWTVDDRDPARDYIGRAALAAQRAAGGLRQLLGLRLEGSGVLRAHQAVETAHGSGLTTSGGFAPTLAASIALARLPAGCQPGEWVTVQLRGGPAPARVWRLPFVRQGQALPAPVNTA